MFACSRCGVPLGVREPGERRTRHVCTSPADRCGFYRQVGKHVYAPVKQGHWGRIVGYSCIECGKEKG